MTPRPPIAARTPQQFEEERQLLAAWRIPTGWRHWSAVNNTVVGQWYIAASLVFFAFGGLLALVMRLQLAQSGNDVVSADTYNQIFTVHGSVMMFLFAVPIFEAVSILMLPQMLGARELPFPRLSAFGFWAFVIGGLFLRGSIFFDAAPAGGWFMYPPLTSARYQPGVGADIWLLGFSFIEVAAIAAAIELIVGVLRSRPPGMRLNLMPIYAWYVLVAAFMVLFAFPPLIAGTILLELERAFGWPFFNPAGGGDPLLWQHLFWLFGHPEVYIIFLPSIALIAMIVPTAARTPIVGYSWVVLAAVGTGFLSFGLWVHHMFTTGLPGVTLAIFSAASAAVAIPTGVQFFCFLATIGSGRPRITLPMLYILGGLATFVIGGLTGVMVAMAPFDLQAHDTFFVVAHLHTVLIGGAVFPLLAGLYYYFPFVRGVTLSEVWGRRLFWIVFAGFNLTFMPMHALGLMGMPRRVFTYSAELGLDTLNMVATVGAFILAAGLIGVAIDVVRPIGNRPRTGRNPWDAGTLEWLQQDPDLPWGVRTVPIVTTRYPLWQQPGFVERYDAGGFYLPDAPGLRREMLITSTIDAEPIQCMRIPGPAWIPLIAAVFIGGAFGAATFQSYRLAGISSLFGIGAVVHWLWTGTNEIPEKERRDVGLGLDLPLYLSGAESTGWWAMAILLLGDFAAFMSIVFGYFFYWTLDGRFVQDSAAGPDAMAIALGLALILGAWLTTWLSIRALRSTSPIAMFLATLAASSILAVAGITVLVNALTAMSVAPDASAYAATVWLLALWSIVHAGVGILMHGYCAARVISGRLTRAYDMDIQNTALFWHGTAVMSVIALGTVAAVPLLGGA
ncbi:MAG: cytochrome c oxidase subunit I [Acidobacteria bacterium]|nr:cytochrome c oxidase subunit I [Acidobacteriota bacterium]